MPLNLRISCLNPIDMLAGALYGLGNDFIFCNKSI